MFDEIIYKLLDKIVTTCERMKMYIKDRSLPKACVDEDARKRDVKAWSNKKKRMAEFAKERENDYK